MCVCGCVQCLRELALTGCVVVRGVQLRAEVARAHEAFCAHVATTDAVVETLEKQNASLERALVALEKRLVVAR